MLVSPQESAAAGAPAQTKPVLRVHVLDCKQPIMHYEADIVRVRKRAREW